MGLLEPDEWARLRPADKHERRAVLETRSTLLDGEIRRLTEHGLSDSEHGLAALQLERDRLTKLIGMDQSNVRRRSNLLRRLAEEGARETKLEANRARVAGAPGRITAAQERRLAAYERLFTALDNQVRVLEELYAPLRERLAADSRLAKLEFRVRRSVDVDQWSAAGEELIDRRRDSPFHGRGTLAEVTRAELQDVWQKGTPAQVRERMSEFASKYAQATIRALASGVQVGTFGEWLFSTDHVRVVYDVRYEGVELERLSPGTRGVVLLTLYLGLDAWDTTPLIIDQPEENLDPQSVYDDLVDFFRSAAQRRQVILVTHNANLVVNADADQVVIAESSRESPVGLPQFSYSADGLEEQGIRDRVCSLLEGGREAFDRRRRRYGARG